MLIQLTCDFQNLEHILFKKQAYRRKTNNRKIITYK